MKRYCAIVALSALVAGCQQGLGPSRCPGPGCQSPVPFPLTGTIRDGDGLPVAGALVEVLAPGRPSSTSDGEGRFRLDDVSGFPTLGITKEGYQPAVMAVPMTAPQDINVVLQRFSVPTTGIIGDTIRGTVNGPPCDPGRWDSSAPCRAFLFKPSADGILDLVLTWTGPTDLDLRVLPYGFAYSDKPHGEIRLSVNVRSGVIYEVWIHSYYSQQDFELRTELRPAS